MGESADRPSLKRLLAVNLDDLAEAVQGAFDLQYYFDSTSGEVVSLNDEDDSLLEDLLSDDDEDEDGEPDQRPQWQKDQAAFLLDIDARMGVTILEIPRVESRQSFRDMEDFIGTVPDKRVREALDATLRGQRPFRRFKDRLTDFPAERERWFAFSADRMRERAMRWLEEIGVEPFETSERSPRT